MFNPDEPLPEFSDIGEIENMVKAGYCVGGSNPTSDQMERAMKFMLGVEEHPQGYQQAGNIIQTTSDPYTRFWALKVLERAVTTRWNVLPQEDRSDIRLFMANFVMHLAEQGQTGSSGARNDGAPGTPADPHRTTSTKACAVLVEVAKREWPSNWPTFVSELTEAAGSGVDIMKLVLLIFRLLGEELFEFEEKKMTKRWVERRRQAIHKDVELIVDVCKKSLQYSVDNNDDDVANSALSTLEKFITSFPLKLVYDTELLTFYAGYLGKENTRVAALKCLSEMANIKVDVANNKTLVNIVSEILFYLCQWLDVGDDKIRTAGGADGIPGGNFDNALEMQHQLCIEERVFKVFNESNEDTCRFFEAATHFLCNALRTNHLVLLSPTPQAALAHRILVGATACNNPVYKDLLVFCTEYWRWWCEYLVLGHARANATMSADILPSALQMGGGGTKGSEWGGQRRVHERLQEMQLPELAPMMDGHRNIFSSLYFTLRTALIKAMMKPQEVLVEEDEGGQLRVVELKEVEDLLQFQRMRQVLVFITMLDPDGMRKYIESLLVRQIDGSEWSWSSFNKICWSAGALSGAMGSKDENAFYVKTLRALLEFCSKKSGKENKAVIASNVMYIVGQYPRFLLQHPRFFRTVCNKLFDFMREPFPGIKDMAVETLLKLATSVPECFSDDNPAKYVDEVISRIGHITSELHGRQVHIFYEALGSAVATIEMPQHRTNSLGSLLSGVNTSLAHLYKEACDDQSIALQLDKMSHLLHMVQTLTAVAKSAGPVFLSEMREVFDSLQFFYTGYSKIILQEIQDKGEQGLYSSEMRKMKAIKKEFLKLVEQFVINTDDTRYVGLQLWPLMMGPILDEYAEAPPITREPTLLAVLAACVEKLRHSLEGEVGTILDKTFNCTKDMIAKNHLDFPEHRVQLFKLLEAVNTHCFNALLSYASNNGDIVHGMLWAASHAEYTVMNSGLNALTKFMREVIRSSMAEGFFEHFYQAVLGGVMECLLNPTQAPGFRQQCEIMSVLFSASKQQQNTESSFHPAQVSKYLASELGKVPSLTEVQIQHFILQGFKTCGQPFDFSSLLADFLIEVQVWGAAEENRVLLASKADQGDGEKEDRLSELIGSFLGLEPGNGQLVPTGNGNGGMDNGNGAQFHGFPDGEDPRNQGALPQSLQALFAVDLYNAVQQGVDGVNGDSYDAFDE